MAISCIILHEKTLIMTDKNILITAITEYSNKIDNIYIENLFEYLRQISNSQKEFYEYRRSVL